MLIRIVMVTLFAAGLSACRDRGPVVEAGDPDLSVTQGRLHYSGKPFTGILRERIPALKEIHSTRYKAGIVHGESTEETEDGLRIASRRYAGGMKHGIHRTWHRNGKPRSYAEFQMGQYRGEVWEWHENGRPYEYSRYDEKGRVLAVKRWRPTGQIYLNQVFDNGAVVGMPGSKLCNPQDKPAGGTL